MSDKLYEIPTDWLGRAYIKDSDYRAMYERSIKDPNGFWANEAKRIQLKTAAHVVVQAPSGATRRTKRKRTA